MIHSINDNLWGFRVIDGAGEVQRVHPRYPDPDMFYAMAPNMGLLGVVSTITLECVGTFDIVGQEAITTIRAAPSTCSAPAAGGGRRWSSSCATPSTAGWSGGRSAAPSACWCGRRPGRT